MDMNEGLALVKFFFFIVGIGRSVITDSKSIVIDPGAMLSSHSACMGFRLCFLCKRKNRFPKLSSSLVSKVGSHIFFRATLVKKNTSICIKEGKKIEEKTSR